MEFQPELRHIEDEDAIRDRNDGIIINKIYRFNRAVIIGADFTPELFGDVNNEFIVLRYSRMVTLVNN